MPLTPWEAVKENTIVLPWLVLELLCFHHGWWITGLACSFYIFLTGLRIAHGSQHYAVGLSRTATEWVMVAHSAIMLGSIHAVQVNHRHHHAHPLESTDYDGTVAQKRWWMAFLIGPWFALRIILHGWRIGTPRQRRWIAVDLVAMALMVTAAAWAGERALTGHVLAMALGNCGTAFFAVWIVHRGLAGEEERVRAELAGTPLPIARTERRAWLNVLTYDMLLHAEHHLYPGVPTPHWRELGRRLDAMHGAPPGPCVLDR